jgi:hypothetical protein
MVSARGNRRSEDGFGINGVVVTVLIISVLMGIIGTMVISGLFQTKSQVGESVGSALSEAAATKLTMAMRAGLISPIDGYSLSEQDLHAISAGADVLVHGSNPDVPDPFEARDRGFDAKVPLVSVREHGHDAEGLWQVLRIVPPKAGVSRDVVVWIRTIREGGTGPASVNTYSVTLRDTPFSSYQLVSDADINFDAAASISGNVHANGATASRATDVIRAFDNVTCANGARVSTARGAVDASRFPGCTVRPGTGRVLDLARAADTARAVESLCGWQSTGGNVACVGSPGGRGIWEVELVADGVRWHCTESCSGDGSMPLPSAADPARPGSVLLFRGAVRLSGSTAGRVTIFGWDVAAPSSEPSWIVGDVLAASPTASVGLVAQGDIVIAGGDAPSCPVATVQAALLTDGRLTLPASVASAAAQSALCEQLTMIGSISGRQSPLLSIVAGDGGAGWLDRRYQFDTRLLRTPPPMFPSAAQWKVARSRVLPKGCAVDASGTTRVLPDDQARGC